MHTRVTPDLMTRLADAGSQTGYEPAGDQPIAERRQPYQARSLADCITNVSTPRGAMPLMKALVTTACERNCYYCPFRAGRGKTQRLTFKPDELAAGFDTLQRSGQVKGMFLSSGIARSPDRSVRRATLARAMALPRDAPPQLRLIEDSIGEWH